MYSKAKIAGHPLHPMLVGLPVTLYLVTLVAFVVFARTADPFWFRVGAYANFAAVITAAVAAIPGFVDWAFGIPRGTPAKETGAVHMALNVAALLVFLLNLVQQWGHRADLVPRVGLSVVLPLIGVLITVFAGFLGWKLVQTHHVGVDLTPEQERQEPRPSPHVDRPAGHPTHGPQVG